MELLCICVYIWHKVFMLQSVHVSLCACVCVFVPVQMCVFVCVCISVCVCFCLFLLLVGGRGGGVSVIYCKKFKVKCMSYIRAWIPKKQWLRSNSTVVI